MNIEIGVRRKRIRWDIWNESVLWDSIFGIVRITKANGIIKPEVPGYAEKIEEYKDLLKKDSSIMSALSFAEKEFAPYSDYLE